MDVPRAVRAPGASESLHFVDGGWRHGDALITLTEGVGIEATLDPLMSEILWRVTSGSTIAAAATEVGEHAGIDPEQAGDLRRAAVAMVRELIATGIVEPGPRTGLSFGEGSDA